ncbi:flagellar export chaperone FliS [Caldanaerobacter subterraneus]|uniref:Flagellar secretion chaperone FliS n=1 Tax=Caldanaerobacter subterraneus TaxID=911092 RepID=A0A4R2KBS1_9THEO|nr:flagellar export chaperone FliS [Caldanaerobacter subterraneus]MCS3916720.1 flagellar protein FliS [Caldanaerobacter subterraneus subsp. tengcongensis MB4]TCO67609.1 flagellar protein FliS [Caldanaerobacter subterraneus]
MNPYQQYKENAILTASPEELVLMLYNGIIRFIDEAKTALQKKDYVETNAKIQRAQDIITELMLTLDMNYDISKNLYNLYDYMLRRLIDANVKKDIEILDEVRGFAVDLRDTWSLALQKVREKVYATKG